MPARLRLAPALALLVACAGEPGEGEVASEATSSATATTQTSTTAASESAGETTSASTATATATATTTPSDACPPPLAICDDTCVDLDHDPEHCGACESPCDPGLACLAGTCGPACGPAATRCGDACVDVDHDPEHCGGCDHACAADTPCIAGACVPSCGAAEIACGEACVDPMADEAHCGGCDNTCPMGQPCVYGRCVEAALHHLLISGQSLSNGHSSQVLSDTQPFSNLSFNTGVRAGAQSLTSMIPLVETWDGARGETIASGLANTVAAAVDARGGEHVILASAHGADGTAYSGVKKGTGPYAAGIAQVTAGFTLAEMQGLPYAVRALAILHGESDHLAGNLAYAENLLAWQSDVEADVQAITGQLHPVPLFLCQMSSFTRLGNSSTSRIPAAQLAAARARPDRIYVVGPKYIFPYVDGVHLSGEGTRWLGEYYAKAYERVLLDGKPWRPLAPASIVREGGVITVDFEVPSPPLVLDTDLVSDPGNFGFEFFDSSGAPPTIAEVALVGPETVQITLSGPPIAGDRRLRYAYTGAPGALAGPTTGARGNLRDSDPRVGASGMPLHNWAVHFDEPVP